MKFYKVLRDNLSSHNTPLITYNSDDWTYPELKGSKLFVFKTPEDAFKHAGFFFGRVVYECEVKNPSKVKYKYLPMSHDINDFWLAKQRHKKPTTKMVIKTPKGSYWGDAVKIESKITKAWKVVVSNNGLRSFISAIDSVRSDGLKYSTKFWTEPKIPKSKLFVFDSHLSAMEFVNTQLIAANLKVYSCYAKNAKICNDSIAVLRNTNISHFWSGYNTLCKMSPLGTLLCDSVQLIKEQK